MRQRYLQFAVTAALAIALAGCGSKSPRPTSELALAGSALKSAEQSGAREHAPIELRIAREKKDAADKAIAEEKYAKARYLTVEAQADAELARAAADAKKTRLELKRAHDNIELLRKDATQTSNTQ